MNHQQKYFKLSKKNSLHATYNHNLHPGVKYWNVSTISNSLYLHSFQLICFNSRQIYVYLHIFTKKFDLITIPESYKIIPIGDFWMLVIFNDLKCKCEKVKWIYQRKIPKLNKCDKKMVKRMMIHQSSQNFDVFVNNSFSM